MPKRCIICEKEAIYSIKGSSEYYCEECASEHFNDLSYLQKIDEIDISKPVDEKVNKGIE